MVHWLLVPGEGPNYVDDSKAGPDAGSRSLNAPGIRVSRENTAEHWLEWCCTHLEKRQSMISSNSVHWSPMAGRVPLHPGSHGRT